MRVYGFFVGGDGGEVDVIFGEDHCFFDVCQTLVFGIGKIVRKVQIGMRWFAIFRTNS